MLFMPLKDDIQKIVINNEEELMRAKGSSLFITGICGFLGRYFLEVLTEFNKNVDQKINLVGVDNLISSGAFGNGIAVGDRDWFSYHQIDVSQLDNEVLSVAMGCDYLIHAAGIASPAHYKKHPLKTIDVAVTGTRSLLDVAKKEKSKFVFFSSSEIYGNPPADQIPIRECFKGIVSSTGPRACYDESKRLGETLCSVFNREFGVHTSVIRPFNVYGPGMQRNDYRVIPNFGYALKDGKSLQVYGSGKQTRTYCYVSDALSGMFKVFFKGLSGHCYNVGTNLDEISALELAERFIKVSGSKQEVHIVNYPSNYPSDEPDRRCPNIEKLQGLGYSPEVDISSGLLRFWNFINRDL